MTKPIPPSRVKAVAAIVITVVCAGCSGARRDANESSAIASVRMVVSAQATHAAFCGGSYAPTLSALHAKGYVPADLGSTEAPSKMGYRLRMTAVKGEGTSECGEVYTDYEVRAEPETPGSTGIRYFRASGTGQVYAATKADFSDAALLQ